MSLTFPRKFARGEKVGHLDVFGELFLWPDGYFQYRVHIRNRDPQEGGCINVNFALLDEKRVPLGTYGLPADQALCVGLWKDLRAGERYDELFGKVPADKLNETAAVALLFRPQGQGFDADRLPDLATAGSELLFNPLPD